MMKKTYTSYVLIIFYHHKWAFKLNIGDFLLISKKIDEQDSITSNAWFSGRCCTETMSLLPNCFYTTNTSANRAIKSPSHGLET